MENPSKKFDFISQPSERVSSLNIDLTDSSRRQAYSQPNSMRDAYESSAYYTDEEAHSSTVANEDEDLSFDRGSGILTERNPDELERNVDGMFNCGGALDVEVMFDKYKELGNELERNLLSLGGKITTQRNVLNQNIRDCEFFVKQKDKNKRTLVEIQIQLENLDVTKQRLMKDCVTDVKNKLESIEASFESIFTNEKYIKNTHHKLNEILQNDKIKFDLLLEEVKSVVGTQNKLCDIYSQKMHDKYVNYESAFHKLCEEELKTDSDLEAIAQQCLVSKQQKACKEFELNRIDGDYKDLINLVLEMNEQKTLLQNQLTQSETDANFIQKQLSENLDTIRLEEKNANERYLALNEMSKIRCEEELKHHYLAKEISRQNSQLCHHFEQIEKEKHNLQNVWSEKQSKINYLLTERDTLVHFQKLNTELNEIIKREECLVDQHHGLETELELKIKEQEKFKTCIKELENSIDGILNSADQRKKLKLEYESMYNSVLQQLEDVKTKLFSWNGTKTLNTSKERLEEVEGLLISHKEKLLALIDKMKVFEEVNKQVMAQNEDIIRQLHSVDQEKEIILLQKSRQNFRSLSLQNLKDYLLDVEDSYLELLDTEETQMDLAKVKEELDKLITEHNKQKEFISAQLNSISDSFRDQVENLNDQMREFKIEKDEDIKNKINQIARNRKTIPKLEEQLTADKNAMSQRLPALIQCINYRMEFIKQLLAVYVETSSNIKNESDNTEAKVVMKSVEDKLKVTMDHLAAISEGPRVVAPNKALMFQQVFSNVNNQYMELLSSYDGTPTKVLISKFTEIAVAVNGGLEFPPKPTLNNDSVFSSQRTSTSDEFKFL